jgi:N utilization substance protein B
MSARRLARELAVIVLPQLPRNKSSLEEGELDAIAVRAVQMLVDYARQSLADADSLRVRAAGQLLDIEMEHPDNAENIESLVSVPVTTGQLREQLELIERALLLASEALDMPEVSLLLGGVKRVKCSKCSHVTEHIIETQQESEAVEFFRRLVSTYIENKDKVTELIKRARAKWKIERMVSIDRDILRLACTEALFFTDVPINVAINEAVELAHRFADEKAVKFINGVLGEIAVEAAHFRKTGQFLEPAPQQETEPASSLSEPISKGT